MVEENKESEAVVNYPPEEESAEPMLVRKKGFGVVTTILLLLMILAAGGYAAWFYLYLPIEALEQGLADEKKDRAGMVEKYAGKFVENSGSLESLRSENAALAEQVGKLAEQLTKRQHQLEQGIHVLRNAQGMHRGDWLVVEAEHLMVTASRVLQISNDFESAAAALGYADDALKGTGDPVWLPVRRQLAREIETLGRTVKPDRVGLSFRLRALGEGLARLPLVSAPGLLLEKAGPPSADKTWREKAEELLRTLVIVDRIAQPEPALLEPQQHYYLIENMKLLIRVAEVSLERADQDSYQRHLRQLAEWIRRYYDPEIPEVAASLLSIKQLEAQTVAPELPDLSASLRQLRKILQQRREELEVS